MLRLDEDEELEDEGMTVYDWVDLVGRSDSIEQMLGYVEDALGPEAAAEYEFAEDGAEIFNSNVSGNVYQLPFVIINRRNS